MKLDASVLEKIIEHYHDLVLVLDPPSSRIIYANNKAKECLGYSEEELSSTALFDIQLKFQDQASWIEHIKEARKNENVFFEGELLTRYGTKIPVEVYSKYVKTSTDEYLFRIIKDISYRKNIEKKLHKSKRFYKALVNNSINVVMILDLEGRYTFVNQVFEKISGYKKKEIIGKKIFDLAHPEDKEELTNIFSEFVNSDAEKIKLSGRFLNKEGSWRTTEGILTKIDSRKGTDCILASIQDISEKVEVEKNLLSKQKFLKKILQSIPHSVWVTDWDGNFMMVNDAFVKIFNTSVDKVIGKSYFDLGIPKEMALEQIEKNRVQMILNEETPFFKESILDPNNGQEYIYLIKKVPIENETSIELLGISIDVTELEKTKQLLIEQNQKLIKVNRELDRFIYSASHELRSPLTSISGLLNIAVDEINDAEGVKNYLKMIDECVFKLKDTLNDILNFSQSTKPELPLHNIDIKALISGIVKTNSNRYKERAIKIIRSINQETPFCSDIERIEIILKNIISNSIKFYSPDTINPFIKIDVNIDKKNAIIEITDNGIGIERKYHEKVFDMFFRASAVQGGTGLGLYNVKEAVNSLGGEVELVSAPGLGTKVQVKIPNLKYVE